jgi:hypothetical protein
MIFFYIGFYLQFLEPPMKPLQITHIAILAFSINLFIPASYGQNTIEQKVLSNIDNERIGYTLIIEGFYLNNLNKNYAIDKSSFCMRMVNGYQFNPYFFMGIGIGAESSATPISLDCRLSLSKEKTSPYLGLNIGYNITSLPINKEGIRINPTIGIKSAINKKIALTFNLGMYWYYSDYNTSKTISYYNYSNTERLNNLFMSMGGGLIFLINR